MEEIPTHFEIDQKEEEDSLDFLVKANTMRNASKVFKPRQVLSVSRRLFEGGPEDCKQHQERVLQVVKAEKAQEAPFWLYPEDSVRVSFNVPREQSKARTTAQFATSTYEEIQVV